MMANIAVCNNKPVDGKDMAEDISGDLKGADTPSTTVSYKYPKSGFSCFVAPKPPPGPVNPPKPTPPADSNIGKACTSADDACGNADGKTDYCCGVASGGKVLDVTGSKVTNTDAPNIVICNKTPSDTVKAVDFTDLITGTDGTMVTALYPGDDFKCMSGAKALLASAVALLAAASMI